VLRLSLPGSAGPRSILAIGAHADDIEIGCGGTILRLLADGEALDVTWVVLSASGARLEEARTSADAFLTEAAQSRVIVGDFRDGFFPHSGYAIKDFFERELKALEPEIILTHTRDDAHQDHRLVSELTWNTFRDHLILEYEIPKYDGDLTRPNMYAPLAEPLLRRKIELLVAHYASQREKDWFDAELFRSLARVRGMECRAPGGYAEAFTCRKLSL
jgi:LmbE family N-acetylglucosaminyl deacetylase